MKLRYTFYKQLKSGTWKYCGKFDTTLHPEYHAYINWCRENDYRWKLVDEDGKIKFEG
jgi:hypothetical protein